MHEFKSAYHGIVSYIGRALETERKLYSREQRGAVSGAHPGGGGGQRPMARATYISVVSLTAISSEI
jgi:hypothetical protein